MFGNFVTLLIGVPVFLFLFWKKLKEDYVSESVFTTAFLVLFGIVLGKLISLKILPGFWFWESALFAFLGLSFGVLKFKLRFYEALEAFTVALLPLVSLLFLTHAILTSNLISFLVFSFLILLCGFYYFLDTHYKSFTWYASGRVGLSGLTILGTFFLARSALAGFSSNVLSLAGSIDSLLSGVLAFVTFLLIYNLARSR